MNEKPNTKTGEKEMKNFTSEELKTKTLKELIQIHNNTVIYFGGDVVKKFRDKPTAIKRVLRVLNHLNDFKKETKERIVKEQTIPERNLIETQPASKITKISNKTKYDFNQHLYVANREYRPKNGSINEFIISNINNGTADDIVNMIVSDFKRPSSLNNSSHSFARGCIIWLVKQEIVDFENKDKE